MFEQRFPGGVPSNLPGVLALVFMVAWCSPALSYVLGPYSISNGTIRGAGGGARIASTLGQHLSGDLGGANYLMGVGFWRIVESSGQGGISSAPPKALSTQLMQNAPNPFNPITTIRFVVGQPGRVDLRLYDLRGREIAVLVSEEMEAGPKELVFEPRGLPSGIYLYRLKTADTSVARRMTLLK